MSGVLVHEWLAPRGGSENVFEALSRVFPDAARYCLSVSYTHLTLPTNREV